MKTRRHIRMISGWVIGLALPSLLLGQSESAKERLLRAIQVTGELEKVAEDFPNPETALPSLERYPAYSQLVKYSKSRPWASAYVPAVFRDQTIQPEPWPGLPEAAELRELLKDKEPKVRGLAAESLATLYQPEDAPLLAELLGDTAVSIPLRGDSRIGIGSQPKFKMAVNRDRDKPTSRRGWEAPTVGGYARRGLKLMTGVEFADGATFLKWWAVNADARHCLWYWQRRIQREMDAVSDQAGSPSDQEDYQKKLAAAKRIVSRAILKELRQLPAEVEAKVRLLTAGENAGGAPITETEDSFWPDPPALRLTPDRLLELLDRKGLWEDVAWGTGDYNLLVERMGISAEVFFQFKDVPHLRTVLARERQELWWSGKAALIIGISRLLPPAAAGDPDDPETRDGLLRESSLHEPDLFVREYCAGELVRVGLPGNAGFLKRVAFEPGNTDGGPTMSRAILEFLKNEPLTVEKRELLADIVLDDRFQIFWTRANIGWGADLDREYAILAINAHAGRKLVTDDQKGALVDPSRSAAALEQVRSAIAELRKNP